MSVLYVALPIALLMGGAALVACICCIRGGQFDDLETPSVRMLIDDQPARVAEREGIEGTGDDSAKHPEGRLRD